MAKGVASWVAVSCGDTDVGRTGLDEQYFCSRSVGNMFPVLNKKLQIFIVSAENFVGKLSAHVHSRDSSVQICTKETFYGKFL